MKPQHSQFSKIDFKTFKKSSLTTWVLCFFMSFFVFHNLNAQNIGINASGASPQASAALDIDFSHMGILIPRIALLSNTDNTTIASPATSLLVFNTSTASDISPGFYYWDGSKWLRIYSGDAGVNAYWSTTGNSGTTASSNFIGTIDNQALVFRTNNVISGKLGPVGITSYGYQAAAVSSSESITAIGANSLGSNSTGTYNTAVGLNSMFSNTTGGSNTGIGYNSAFSNTFGNYNCAIGTNALFANSTGSNNVAIGNDALRSNITAHGNVAVGESSMYTNTSGANNCAIGFHSFYSNTSGTSNVAIGYSSLNDNDEGGNNVAIGVNTLYHNTSGIFNVAIGSSSLNKVTTSTANLSIGHGAFSELLSGNYNTSLGTLSNYTSTDVSNSIAIGYTAINTASNQARIGNTTTTSIGGQVSWTTLSDGRFKQNVEENVPGLAFIMKLRPVTYYHNLEALADFYQTPDTLRQMESEKASSKILHTGFIAQEVEQAASDINFDFHGIDKPKNEKSHYGLRYAEFTVPTIKAIQEQQSEIEDLKLQLLTLQTSYETLQYQLDQLRRQLMQLQTK